MNTVAASKDHVRQLLGWLGDREHQLQMALDAAELGTWHWNPASGELFWSDRCRSLLGLDLDTPASFEKFVAVIHASDRTMVVNAITEAQRSKSAYSVEFRVQLQSGEERWLHSLGRVRTSKDGGRVLQMSGVVRDVTQSHLATATLARQTAELQQLMQAAPVGIAKFDRSVRFLAVNPCFASGLGIGGKNVIGLRPCDVFATPPLRWRELFQRCLEGETLSGEDETFNHVDGGIETLSWHAFPWFDDSDAIGGVVLLTEILTTKRRLEEQARLWASAFSHNANGMAIVDPATCTLRSANAAYGRLLGYTEVELTGRSVFTLYPETEHARLRAAVARADADGTAAVDISRLHRDGTMIPTTLNMVSVRDAAGAVDYRIVTVTDQSDRERNLAKLRHQDAQRLVDQRFRLLAESAPVGIMLANADGVMTYVNPAWLAITAITLGEALNMDWFELVHADDRERVNAAWQRTLRGADFDLEFRYRRPSGEVRWVRAHATALKDESGSTLGYIRTALDITDRLLERAAADRFHSQVRLMSERWQQLREVERKETAASLRAGMYESLTQLKSQLEELTPAHGAGLVAQTESVLNKLRHALFELTPPGIAELGFTGALERYVSEQASRSGVEITLSVAEKMPEAPQEILLVIYAVAQEAIANALKHASATSVDVSFEINNETARLRVSDNGIGIDEKDRNKAGCFGLLAASERLAHIGGTLRTLGIAGRGTRLEASVALQERKRLRDQVPQ
jgi:PAS domain S-box-containing protein